MAADLTFPPMKNDLLLRAARGEETERAPVWVMRQAGRYLPEFHKVRAHHSFFEICRTPELAMELTLQPIRRYSGLIDAAIIFSDILVVPQALGMEVEMNPGPHFPDPLNTPEDLSKLRADVDVNKELGYVFDAITITRKALDGEVPLIGFCGAPWTLFSYMVEGGSSKTFTKCKSWLFRYPEESKALLLRIADVCVDFLVGQVKAGAQLLQIFDSWAGELAPHHFQEFSLPSLQRISLGVRRKLAAEKIPLVPMTVFPKGANSELASLAHEGGYDVIGLDWCIEPSEARRLVGDKVAVQGNLDPNVLYGGRESIEREVKRMCASFKGGKGTKAWIANLGHGITPGVDPDDLKWFFECVHKYSSNA
ncbi:uroporphyrinogen decarboxylase [Sparassis latifolia]|uniref:Uroporphyrinogen decarboxylase n=1 Tax=Sparassis crispa TaxID=139825 RepID=A0A401GAE7_9APHY|nr:Uroporphyrinogen decarboxylase [Sparassis crispa]GBE79145.1 Uroporphyrinogen decarboxylase [Sparassis crispa]